jgi:hypothetical protein
VVYFSKRYIRINIDLRFVKDNPIQGRIAQEVACYTLKVYSTFQYHSYTLLMTVRYLGMDHKVPRQVKLDALIMKKKNVIVPQIVQSLPLSKSTIYRIQRNVERYGDIEPKKKKPGPQPLIPRGIGYVLILHQSIRLIMK